MASARRPSPRESAAGAAALEQALSIIELLASEVGPRRPTSIEERRAAELLASELRSRNVPAELEPFQGYSTFAAPFAVILALALAPALVPRRRRLLRALGTTAAAAGLATEGGLTFTPLSALLSTRASQNLVATLNPRAEAKRTLCLMCHLDTSRSGLMFHPAFVRHLNRWIVVQAVAVLALGSEPLAGRRRAGRAAMAAARAVAAAGIALLAERELRGEDVPGANDNASGVAVCSALVAHLTGAPLESTRVVLLATGCEESGLLGAQAFLRSHDTEGWLFLNFDSVGGPATLRFCASEGLVQKRPSDPGLVRLAERVARDRPELGIEPAAGPIGLTYDATAVLARGGRALTFVAGDGGVIPNYHHPSDTVENVHRGTIEKALEMGREMIAVIDRGEADQQPDASRLDA